MTYSRRRLVQEHLQARADTVLRRSAPDPTRHKCFVSYHVDDADEVKDFIDDFGSEFIPRVIGLSEGDDFIDSVDDDYVLRRIREKYLTDSTVTIVLVGRCTWSRRFVDWEVSSSLRDDFANKRSGLVAITLPSVADLDGRRLPDRVDDNVDDDNLYARWMKYPASRSSLRNIISEAFDRRTSRADLVRNGRARMTYNRTCP
jgi:hypothetical protein